jgi:hypothetical protein
MASMALTTFLQSPTVWTRPLTERDRGFGVTPIATTTVSGNDTPFLSEEVRDGGNIIHLFKPADLFRNPFTPLLIQELHSHHK